MTALQALQKLMSDKEYIRGLPREKQQKIYAYSSMLKAGRIKRIDTILEEHGYIQSWEKKRIKK